MMYVCMHVCMYVGSVHVAEWLGWQPTKGRTQVRYFLRLDRTSVVCDAAADTLYGPTFVVGATR